MSKLFLVKFYVVLRQALMLILRYSQDLGKIFQVYHKSGFDFIDLPIVLVFLVLLLNVFEKIISLSQLFIEDKGGQSPKKIHTLPVFNQEPTKNGGLLISK